jgi:D-galactose 1-dehydrogenase
VEQAKAWLATRPVRKVDIQWREDVRRWHPGQAWIWRAGGLGVFDPGINALSILTEILPTQVFVTDARLRVPENVQSPVAAHVVMTDLADAAITADFDFLQTGPQTWDLTAWTDDGVLKLSMGGAKLEIDGTVVVDGLDREYAGLYERFAGLVAPLVADAFVGTRRAEASWSRHGPLHRRSQ